MPEKRLNTFGQGTVTVSPIFAGRQQVMLSQTPTHPETKPALTDLKAGFALYRPGESFGRGVKKN